MRILLYGIYAAAISTVQAITQKTNEVEEVLRVRSLLLLGAAARQT